MADMSIAEIYRFLHFKCNILNVHRIFVLTFIVFVLFLTLSFSHNPFADVIAK